jgi:predicted branched-subunit amino acid permease
VKRWWRDEHLLMGMRDMASISPGMAAWGLMTGVAMVQSDLSRVELVFMALFVFAGSSQLAALPLIAAGAPLWVVLATAFCVNLRFVVFSAHLRDYMMDMPLPQRLLRGYATADLSYMMMLRHWPQAAPDLAGRQQQRSYLAGSGLLAWICWTSTSLLGAAFASSIPMSWGLSFASTLALTGIVWALTQSTLRGLAVVIAGSAAVATFALPLKLNIVVAIAAAVCVCMVLEKLHPALQEQERQAP